MAWDEETEVVVIGSGLAGLAAAIEAGEAGAQVIVLEKMKITGGNTRISDGALAAPCNHLQTRAGIKDSARLFFEDMQRAGLGLNHPELLRTFAESASETIEWTRHTLGVEYLDRLDRLGGHSVARSLTTRSHCGVDIIKAQVTKLDQLGVEIRTRCQLRRLVADEGGAVLGVEVAQGYRFPDGTAGRRKLIRARRAVVLATGGFGNDTRFRSLQHPGLDESVHTARAALA